MMRNEVIFFVKFKRLELLNLFSSPFVLTHFRSFAKSSSDPYKILGLSHTCTIKEIKLAYKKLCKELHPDIKPGDSTQHKKFIELNDAYTTLMNIKSRKRFDERFYNASYHSRKDDLWKAKPHMNRPFEKNTEEQERSSNKYKEYYSYIKNQSLYQKRREDTPHKITIVIGCFLLIVIGSFLYLSAYRFASYNQMRKVDEKSKRLSEEYSAARQSALKPANNGHQPEKLKNTESSA